MRKLYTGIFLGISLFAILGLAIGPTIQTTDAHTPGVLEEHCLAIDVSTDHSVCQSIRHGLAQGCTIPSIDRGVLHFVDIDGDLEHDHGSDGQYDGKKTRGEPTVCLRVR